MDPNKKPSDELLIDLALHEVMPDALKTAMPIADIEEMILLMPGATRLRGVYEKMKADGTNISFSEVLAHDQDSDLETILARFEEHFGEPDSDKAYVDLIAEKILVRVIEIEQSDSDDGDGPTLGRWIVYMHNDNFETLRAKNPVLYERARRKVAEMLGMKALTKAHAFPEDNLLATAFGRGASELSAAFADAIGTKLLDIADEPLLPIARANVDRILGDKKAHVTPKRHEELQREYIAQMRANWRELLKKKE